MNGNDSIGAIDYEDETGTRYEWQDSIVAID